MLSLLSCKRIRPYHTNLGNSSSIYRSKDALMLVPPCYSMHAHARRMEVLSTMEAAPRYGQGGLELQSSPLQNARVDR